jgi:hypothetical protein
MLTKRQKHVLKACLSYAYSNVDDINDVYGIDDEAETASYNRDDISEQEIESLAETLGVKGD